MFVLFAASVFLTAASSHATPVGDPFLRGMTSPMELADKIQASLAVDPTGQTIIDSARCNRDGSCARPSDYLVMLQESDPSAHLGAVADLVPFLRSLVQEVAPSGQYWMACLKVNGSKRTPFLHCISRNFAPGEKAWVDPNSERIVLAQNCTNPVEKPVSEACVEVHFWTHPGDQVVRFALLGPEPVSDDCVGVERAGESSFERWWPDECELAGCDFSQDAVVVGEPVQMMGSYVPQPGEHRLRLPAFVAAQGSLYTVVLCLEGPDGQHSDGVSVVPLNYHSGFATVWYSSPDVPVRYLGQDQHWTWGEWRDKQ